MKVIYIHDISRHNTSKPGRLQSHEIHESLVFFFMTASCWIWIDNLMWTGQLPTEEHFNHLLAMVQQAMSATGVRLKVAPLAIESLQPKKKVRQCADASPNGFNTSTQIVGRKGRSHHPVTQKGLFVSQEIHRLDLCRTPAKAAKLTIDCNLAGAQY